ncbi:hypothetical protein FRC20_010344 [Serendipita sp. 405]|nr:hypothetical protein FRC15_011225 [Serendipita sp. 397]KAG8864160.1 hypothetical protein FRC20_010344 [Serendipita sp. 405]
MSTVEIFPPVGIARAGDSEEYYISSEDPAKEHADNFNFRDAGGKLRRSAVKFHAYEYKDGKPDKEIKQVEGCEIEWTVNVANAKALAFNFRGRYQAQGGLRNAKIKGLDDRKKKLLIQASGSISGKNKGPVTLQGNFKGSTSADHPVTLGTLYTDGDGCLIFVAGTGEAKSVLDPNNPYPDLENTFNNDDWFDTMCDGEVKVKVKYTGSNSRTIASSLRTAVVTAPPKYTSGVSCSTSLYDVIEDIYERPKRGQDYDCGKVYYESDIKRIFDAVMSMSWTNKKANEGHGSGRDHHFDHSQLRKNDAASKALRTQIFKWVRAPVKFEDAENAVLRDAQASEKYMPRISGDDGDLPEENGDQNSRNRWASVTELQYDRLAKWAKGDFESDGSRDAGAPDMLTLAALKWTTGAALYPGIEMWWITQFSEVYNPHARFRFRNGLQSGDLTKGLALPWQGDFYACKPSFISCSQFGLVTYPLGNTHWWPHVRPDDIVSWQTFQRMKGAEPYDLTREPWADGLGQYEEEHKGGVQMVKKWTKLGFISPAKSNPAVLVETDRTLWLRGGKYTVSNVARGKFVGASGSGGETRPIATLASTGTWELKYIKGGAHQLSFSAFIAAPQASEVHGYKTPSNVEAATWIIKPGPNDTYTIETSGQPPKFWSLTSGNDGTTVSLVDKADSDSQRWKLIPVSS